MKKGVNIYILSLIALFFVSTTGVTVYKHYCNHEGEFYRLFIDIEHECEPEELENHECLIEELVSLADNADCCTVDEAFHDDCCTDDVEFYQIDSDLIIHDGEINVDITPLFAFSTPFDIVPLLKEHKDQPTANSPPYTIPTTKRLAQLQMYLL